MEQTKEPKEMSIKQKAKPSVVIGVMVTFILFICGTLYVTHVEPMAKGVFVSSIIKNTETDTIGTNITLSQTIRGESDRITYRYKLKTDCPFWTYEDRYVTTHPLTWLSDTAAVETEATRLQINLNGATLITGQYFYVPLLDLRQNDKTYEDFETTVINTAYQQYCTNITEVEKILHRTILIAAFIICLIMLTFMLSIGKKTTAKHEKSQLDDTDISADATLCYTKDETETNIQRKDENHV